MLAETSMKFLLFVAFDRFDRICFTCNVRRWLSPFGGKKEIEMSEKYLASYGIGMWERERTDVPQIHQYLKYEGYVIPFILPDQVRVKLVSAPDPEMVGMEGYWGKLREKLHWERIKEKLQKRTEEDVEQLTSCLLERIDFWVEVLDDRPYWLCYPPTIMNAVSELRDKVFRRNRQIEDMRKQLAETKQLC